MLGRDQRRRRPRPHDHISLPVTEGSKMRSNMPITGYWPIRHTLRARKHNSTDIDDTYSNSHCKRRSTEHIHAQIRRRRAPMVAQGPRSAAPGSSLPVCSLSQSLIYFYSHAVSPGARSARARASHLPRASADRRARRRRRDQHRCRTISLYSFTRSRCSRAPLASITRCPSAPLLLYDLFTPYSFLVAQVEFVSSRKLWPPRV